MGPSSRHTLTGHDEPVVWITGTAGSTIEGGLDRLGLELAEHARERGSIVPEAASEDDIACLVEGDHLRRGRVTTGDVVEEPAC